MIEVIRDSVQRRGYPPSMREIGQAVGLSSTSSVAHQLMALERKGFLRRDPHRPRAYEVRASDAPTSQTTDTTGKPAASWVPLADLITAGGPVVWSCVEFRLGDRSRQTNQSINAVVREARVLSWSSAGRARGRWWVADSSPWLWCGLYAGSPGGDLPGRQGTGGKG